MVLRIVRIIAITLGFVFIFSLSHQATLARGGEDLPGFNWALGVLTVIFSASAIFSERTRGSDMNLQKDFMWGMSAGGLITLIVRLT